MTRVVGSQGRSPYILDATEAWRIGGRLDAFLASSRPRGPAKVVRGSHASLNAMDDSKRLAAAMRLAGGAHDGR